VLVPVSFVGGVQMAVVQVVHMVTVGHGGMAAARAVLMRVLRVFHARVGDTFVPVVAVFVMAMTVVHVIDVITMANRHMTAIGPVHVRMLVLGRVILIGMPMRVGCGHVQVSHR